MYLTLITFFTFCLTTILACNPDTPGCDHPGNFTGELFAFVDPSTAHCDPGNQTSNFASVPLKYYNPPDESPCDTFINVTHPVTKKTISATVIGECGTCRGDSIKLTRAGLVALSPNGRLKKAPGTVNWTFV